MTKNLLSLSISFLLLGFVPSVSMANPSIEIMEFADIETQGIVITVNQGVIHVSGAAGQIMQIYNITGVCVLTTKVDGDEKNFDLNLQKGCYIIKVGKVVRKVSIR